LTGEEKKQALKGCRTSSAKSALEDSLGEDVTNTDVQMFVEDGAREKTRMVMKAAMNAAGDGTPQQKRSAARASAKTALKESLGVDEVSDTEFQFHLNEGASDYLRSTIKACYDSDASTDKAKCFGNFELNKDAIKESMGKAEVSHTEFNRLKKKTQTKALVAMNKAFGKTNASDISQEGAVKEELKVYGVDLDTAQLKFSILLHNAGVSQVARAALACDSAGVGTASCKFEEERNSAMGKWSLKKHTLATIKRDGAEELLARELLAQSQTSRGITSVGGGVEARNSYLLLREKKFEEADVARVKSKMVGDYLLDCQEGVVKEFAECLKEAEMFSKGNLKSKLPVSDSLARSQFEAFFQGSACDKKCSTEVSDRVEMLGLNSSEIKARKVSAAITAAADARADCLQDSEQSQTDCESVGKDAFKKLSRGYDKSERIRKLVEELTDAKVNGVVTEIRKDRSITTVASYNGPCVKATSRSIKDTLKMSPEWRGKVLRTDIDTESSTGESGNCEVVLFSTFSETVSFDEVDMLAKGMKPTQSGRRLNSAVSTSSSMTVVESKSESKSEPKSEQASSDMKSEKPAENDSLIIIISLVVVVGLVAGILVIRKMGNKQEAYNDADADLEMSVNRWSESINTTFNPIGNNGPSVAVAIQQQ
jgi:hypothetical protein